MYLLGYDSNSLENASSHKKNIRSKTQMHCKYANFVSYHLMLVSTKHKRLRVLYSHSLFISAISRFYFAGPISSNENDRRSFLKSAKSVVAVVPPVSII